MNTAAVPTSASAIATPPVTAPFLSENDVIIVIPRDTSRERQSFGTGGYEAARQGPSQQQMQRRLESTVADIQAKYAQLGIRPSEGNGRMISTYVPQYENAAYLPKGGRLSNGVVIPDDSIIVGRDSRSGQPFLESEDVIAHELGHRILDHITKQPLSLDPRSQDAALHESIADTFAALIDDVDPWTLGEELVEPVRHMDHPEVQGDPGTIAEMNAGIRSGQWDTPIGLDERLNEVTATDPHWLAGVPNKAASIIGAQLGRDTLGKIYIDALRKYVGPGQKFEGFAVATMRSAIDLFGPKSREALATRDAWDAVGVLDLVTAQLSPARA